MTLKNYLTYPHISNFVAIISITLGLLAAMNNLGVSGIFILCGIVISQPFARLVERICNKRLPPIIQIITSIAIFFVGMISVQYQAISDTQEIVIIDDGFDYNKGVITTRLKALLDESDWLGVIEMGHQLLPLNDAEINALYDQAISMNNAHYREERTTQLMQSVSVTDKANVQQLLVLYNQLYALDPDNKAFAKEQAYYAKLNEDK